MKKQEKFSAAEQKMQETGISREKAETQTEFESRKEYPFEVVYVDGSRSRQPEDKKIWGVVVNGKAVCLHVSGNKKWDDGRKYCAKVVVGGVKARAGRREFWEQFDNMSRAEVLRLDNFFKFLGGDPIKGPFWYWTEEESGKNPKLAWRVSLRLKTVTSLQYKEFDHKNVVRPVVDLQ